MSRYVIYLRKSRKDLELEAMGEGETLARHRAALLAYAKKHGLKIVKIYEEMVSGESIADRPEMQKLLQEVEAGEYDGVLVMEVERLARGKTKDQGEVAEAFFNSETLIVTPTKTYDPTNEFDEEYFEFSLFMSRREYKTILRRMKRGIEDAIQEGNYLGSIAPYGYDINRINKKERTLKFNHETENVRKIFDWFTEERLTAGEIARRLTLMGVPTRKGKTEWNKQTVSDILKNPIHTGKITWKRRACKKETVEGKRKNTRRRSKNFVLVDGKHPAIISEEQFAFAQTLFSGQVPVKANTTLVNPFAHLIVCKHCGKTIQYQAFDPRKNVQPRIHHKPSAKCKVKSALFEQVQEAVILNLKEYIQDFEFSTSNEGELEEQKNREAVLESMKTELEKLKKKKAELYDLLEDETYTKEEYKERKQIYIERIEKLTSSIEAEEAKTFDKIEFRERIIKFSEVIDSLQNPDIPARRKNDLMKEIVSKIEYDCIDYGHRKGGKVLLNLHLR